MYLHHILLNIMKKIIFLWAAVWSIALMSCAQEAQQNKTGAIAQNDKSDAAVQKIKKSDAEWKTLLNEQQYEVLREKGTERAFSSPLNNNKKKGFYTCAACKQVLFGSEQKFDSGTGWPSFWQPYSPQSIITATDHSHGMERDEVVCARCGGHLGHMFGDGPEPTGLRYCINGTSLQFDEQLPPQQQQNRSYAPKAGMETAVFAQGCFWCMEEIFEQIIGVDEVISGYTGGAEANPTYKAVGSGSTGHAEAIEIQYDPRQITYEQLLKVYFFAGDVTQENGQGPDIGKQYRSAIFYKSEAEQKVALRYIEELEAQKLFTKKIAVEVLPYRNFYPAEAYHQNYARLNPADHYVQAVSLPRCQNALAHFPELVKPDKKKNSEK